MAEVEVMSAVIEGKEAEVKVDLNHIENVVEVDRVVAIVDLQDTDIEQLDVQDNEILVPTISSNNNSILYCCNLKVYKNT